MEHVVPLTCYENHIINFKIDDDIDLAALRNELYSLGYENAAPG